MVFYENVKYTMLIGNVVICTVSVLNLLIYLTIRNVNSETDLFFEHKTNGLLLNTFLNSKCLKSIF